MSNLWEVFDYERNMSVALWNRLVDSNFHALPWEVKNAIVESLVLHTRILADILTSKSKYTDDITLQKVLPTFVSAHIASLTTEYGRQSDVDKPCWQFNKLMAHPTTHRSNCHDYLPALETVWPHLAAVLSDIESVRKSVNPVS
jgi:hypothetical protein